MYLLQPVNEQQYEANSETISQSYDSNFTEIKLPRFAAKNTGLFTVAWLFVIYLWCLQYTNKYYTISCPLSNTLDTPSLFSHIISGFSIATLVTTSLFSEAKSIMSSLCVLAKSMIASLFSIATCLMVSLLST